MTIIAGFQIGKYTILIGDVVLSLPASHDIVRQTQTDSNYIGIFPEHSQRIITEAKQKICLINDRVAVAWSGSYIEAKTVIKELIKQDSINPLTFAYLKAYFPAIYKKIERLGVSFIIAIYDPTNKTSYLYEHNTYTYKNKIFGKMFIAGSGKDYFVHFLKKNELALIKRISEVEFGAINIATIITSFLQSLDFTGRSLKKYFGGGYEIAFLVNGKVRKADNLFYIYWYVKCISEGNIGFPTPTHIYSYKYLHDILSVRTLALRNAEDCDGQMELSFNAPLLIVPPINRSVDKKEIDSLLTTEFMSITDRFDPQCLSGFFVSNIFIYKDNEFSSLYLVIIP